MNIFKLFRDKHINVLIDTTNGCNLRCAFCTRDSNNVSQMATAEFNTILSKLNGHISNLQLSCAWEYSIAKNAADNIRTIGNYSIPWTSIYTNGNKFSTNIALALIDSQINEYVVSIGEVRKETYERLRKGGNFENVIANIRMLQRLKTERNSILPRICANLTIVNSNISELVEFVDLAYSVGIEEVRGRHLILNEGLDMSYEVITDKVNANYMIEVAENKALGYGIRFYVPKYELKLSSKNCQAPWQQLYISSNGDVSVCPRIHMYVNLGNLLTDSLDNIINGKHMNDLKRQFNTNCFSNPVCGICMDNRETEVSIDQRF